MISICKLIFFILLTNALFAKVIPQKDLKLIINKGWVEASIEVQKEFEKNQSFLNKRLYSDIKKPCYIKHLSPKENELFLSYPYYSLAYAKKMEYLSQTSKAIEIYETLLKYSQQCIQDKYTFIDFLFYELLNNLLIQTINEGIKSNRYTISDNKHLHHILLKYSSQNFDNYLNFYKKDSSNFIAHLNEQDLLKLTQRNWHKYKISKIKYLLPKLKKRLFIKYKNELKKIAKLQSKIDMLHYKSNAKNRYAYSHKNYVSSSNEFTLLDSLSSQILYFSLPHMNFMMDILERIQKSKLLIKKLSIHSKKNI